MSNHRQRIVQVTSRTRKLCFDIRRNGLCGGAIQQTAGFSIDVFREGKEQDEDLIISYDFFEADPEGRLCIVLDDQLLEECPGRYIARLMYGCEPFDYLRFEIGCRPVVAGAPAVVESVAGECLPGLGELADVSPIVEPSQCCDEELCLAPETCCPERRCDRVVELCPEDKACGDYPDLGLAHL